MNASALSQHERKWDWVCDLLLIGVLLVGAYFCFIGIDWGELQHQHPDELFLTSVTYDIGPVHSLAEYFDTATSTLNPHNRGHGFYAYGTLPIFIVRYLAESTGKLDSLKLFGRQMSAVANMLTILLLYIIAARLYGRRVALLAAAFSALAVMQIQQSHFYTTDLFANLFIFLAIYFAVEIAIGERRESGVESRESGAGGTWKGLRFSHDILRFIGDPLLLLNLGFGFALGMAVACKLNAVPLAILLPAALIMRALNAQGHQLPVASYQSNEKTDHQSPITDHRSLITGHLSLERIIIYLALGALASLLAFRLFQPYAFSGPGFFGLKPDPQWIANVREQRVQASGDADLPWNLQWARRSHLFSFTNLTVWGLGLPLGILAWDGFLWMGWRILKGEWRPHVLLWGWTAFYFVWQSLQYNPTMRYQLPIYPLLAMMAAWLIVWLWDKGRRSTNSRRRTVVYRLSSIVLGVVVLALTAAWAFAFTRIYTRPEPRIAASRWIYQNVPGPINLRIQTPDGATYQQPLSYNAGFTIQSETPYGTVFVARWDGMLTEVMLSHAANATGAGPQTLSLSLASVPDAPPEQILARASITADFAPQADPRGQSYLLTLGRPVSVVRGQTYFLRLETTGGALTLAGSAVVNETDYDYGLPFRIDSYDGFGGLYRGDLNLQVYWDDNPDKLARFLYTLNEADYIFVPTNHQYGQITRLPERYPLTTVYYRELIGCPPEKDIIWCYRVAEPGTFHGRLGFDLVATFENYPTLGPLVINDQAAEEAFTFYDHPKVLIFKKRADYDPAQVQAVLGAVDLTRAVHLTPRQADAYRDLMLPTDRLTDQRTGGTWSELFDTAAIHNKYPLVGLVLWYLTIFATGLFAYPLVRAALPGLSDRGYPLARTAGLLLWAWLSWLAGSAGIPYNKATIGVALGLVALIGGALAYCQREELKQEWSGRRKYFLFIEGLFLAFFLLNMFIRIGNPDLWHPAKGGERPMNFSYFNAVLKSTTFPPYDPWFAGGYINYYYYGYVIVGTPVKLLGIVPSIAFNFILPTLYAMLAVSAFSVGWDLLDHGRRTTDDGPWSIVHRLPLIGGLSAASAMVLLGNLGIVRMVYQGFQRMAAPGGIIDEANIFLRWFWAAKGLLMALGGDNLPFGRGDWYWNPSRVIPPGPGNEITEFPLFTFIYSDLHAHMIALLIAVVVIGWGLSILLGRARWQSPGAGALSFFLGGLTIGALYPTNLSDIYTYLPLAGAALAYAVWRYADIDCLRWLRGLPNNARRLILVGASLAVLTLLSFWLYQPYRDWYLQAYNALDRWQGEHTPIWSYLTHWGLFLFVIVSWMAWETRQWMATTPVSALNKLRPYQIFIEISLALLLAAVLFLLVSKVAIGWLVLPLAAWAGVLILRPGMTDAKRGVLFMVGTGLLITLVVELVVVRGDIGRMNTIFKFYLQAWILLGLSTAAAFGWLLLEISKWLPGWRTAWQMTTTVLVACAALFLLLGGLDKIRDRIATNAPHTLDSVTYMAYATYADFGVTMDLSEDYRAIRWMQENVTGSPVILEAAGVGIQYRWFSRFSIYTGLPTVVGWEWHQRQQRVFSETEVYTRGIEVRQFYETTDLYLTEGFLEKYNVKYIVVGQLERAFYLAEGLSKFDDYNGVLWNEVYRDGQTVIYEVLSQP